MKNKINTAFLTLLMLFATLYPSGQAYANGLPPNIANYTSTINNSVSLEEKEQMVDKLSTDIDLLHLINGAIYFWVKNQNTKFKEMSSQWALLNKEDKDVFAIENGFENSSKFEVILANYNKVMFNISNKYPKLKHFNKEEIIEVFEKSYNKSLLHTASENQCYINAQNHYVDCLAKMNASYAQAKDAIISCVALSIAGGVFVAYLSGAAASAGIADYNHAYDQFILGPPAGWSTADILTGAVNAGNRAAAVKETTVATYTKIIDILKTLIGSCSAGAGVVGGIYFSGTSMKACADAYGVEMLAGKCNDIDSANVNNTSYKSFIGNNGKTNLRH